ncbi:MAG: hypothetical protein CMJ75_22835 [Planctomycetaceae bacterium]|nr:hypothetical protein [Planctomycetaceae bacterium]
MTEKQVKKTKNKGGRPCKLTRRVQDRIVKALSVGCTQGIACKAAGIGARTYHRWITRGEEDIEAGNSSSDFAVFSRAVQRAEALFFERCAATISEASLDSWQAAAWMLERRLRDDYGKMPPPPKVDRLLEVGLVLFDVKEPMGQVETEHPNPVQVAGSGSRGQGSE